MRLTHHTDQSNKTQSLRTPQESSKSKHKVAFSGSAVANVLSKIEQSPTLSLATLDLFGMVIPRTLTELNRNKEELGHFNWHAGRERLCDEISSSLVLYLTPGVILNYLGNKLLEHKYNRFHLNTKSFIDYDNLSVIKSNIKQFLEKTTTETSVNTLRENVAREILNNTSGYSNPSKKLSKKLIDEIVDIIKNLKNKASLDQVKNSITSNDTQALSLAKQSLLIDKEKTLKDLCDKQNIFNKIAEQLEETEIGILGKKNKIAKSSPQHLIREIVTATDDLVTKAATMITKKGHNIDFDAPLKPKQIEKLTETVKQLVKSLKNIKIAKTLIPFGTTLLVLMTVPKINTGLTRRLTGKNEFPGVSGLVNNDKSEPPKPPPLATTSNNYNNIFAQFEKNLISNS